MYIQGIKIKEYLQKFIKYVEVDDNDIFDDISEMIDEDNIEISFKK